MRYIANTTNAREHFYDFNLITNVKFQGVIDPKSQLTRKLSPDTPALKIKPLWSQRHKNGIFEFSYMRHTISYQYDEASAAYMFWDSYETVHYE